MTDPDEHYFDGHIEHVAAQATMESLQRKAGASQLLPVVYMRDGAVRAELVRADGKEWYLKQASRLCATRGGRPHVAPEAIAVLWKACAHHAMDRARHAGVEEVRVEMKDWEQGRPGAFVLTWQLGRSASTPEEAAETEVASVGEVGPSGYMKLITLPLELMLELMSEDIAFFSISRNELHERKEPVIVQWSRNRGSAGPGLTFRVGRWKNGALHPVACFSNDYTEIARSELW